MPEDEYEEDEYEEDEDLEEEDEMEDDLDDYDDEEEDDEQVVCYGAGSNPAPSSVDKRRRNFFWRNY